MMQTPSPNSTPPSPRRTPLPLLVDDDLGDVDHPTTDQDLAAPLPRVETWEGRYELGPRLGEGGMSIVHEAHDLLLGRTVALKELLRSDLYPAHVLASEARALAAVDHPGVVRVYAVYPSSKRPFLVMERARGRSLASILEAGPLPIARILPILRQIAGGVDALHAAGIIHGDVKPGNVVVDDDGLAKLIDVGLAPFFERMRSDEILGTPSYVAPERAGGVRAPADLATRGDVYSFGVLCFEMLTGRLPFEASSTTETLIAHATQAPPMASEVAGVSTEFDEPLARALAKSPERRPATCTEVVTALERASKGCDVNGRRLRVLVADDDEGQRLLLMSVLGAYLPGASVELCGTGDSVLEAIPSHPSVAVLDLAMPGPSGIDLIRRVRALSPTTAIVIVTGGGSGAERQAARDLGVRRFLVKPFEVDELVLAIREAVEREVPAAVETGPRNRR